MSRSELPYFNNGGRQGHQLSRAEQQAAGAHATRPSPFPSRKLTDRIRLRNLIILNEPAMEQLTRTTPSPVLDQTFLDPNLDHRRVAIVR